MLHCSKHGRSCARKCSQWAFVMLTYLICVSETKVSIAEGKISPSLHNQRASNSVLKAALFLSNALLYSVASINHSSLHNTRIPEDKIIWLRQNKSLLCKHVCLIKLHLFEQSCDHIKTVAVLLNWTWSNVQMFCSVSMLWLYYQ